MNQGLPPEIFEQLQKVYIQSFDEKMQELESAFANRNFEQLRALFHKIAGSGKTYGFAEISEVARAAELEKANAADAFRKHIDRIQSLFNRFKTAA